VASRIEDYGLIGDLQTAALVSREGSIDWLCFPRFDSAACFAALVGTEENGRWSLRPTGDLTRVERRYRGNGLVLETELECADGAVRLTDFMPVRGEAPDVVRIVEGLRGRVRMRTDITVRFDYGSIVPWVRRVPEGTLAVAGPDALLLASPVELVGENMHTVAEFDVEPGDRVPFVLTWYPSNHDLPAHVDAEAALAETEAFWDDWTGTCTDGGIHRDALIRSLVTLKALTYAPTGGIVAAPTTSLPECLGGVRNWDYRFCWVRDATLTLLSLIRAGYADEASAWRDWLLRAIAGSPDGPQALYGLAGERRIGELELPWLEGYEGSRPVRIGNAACTQFQLDVYGEILDALYQARAAGLPPLDDAWSLCRRLLELLEDVWREPDEGIWEVRGPRRHFTHSKVMAWVAFDRGVRIVEEHGRTGPVERWLALRDEVHAQVCREGFHEGVGAFTQSYGSDRLDASLLLLPLVGFLPVDDPRIAATVAAIERDLTKDGLVERYRADEENTDVDGLPPGEGTFLPCSFWLVEVMVLQGRREEAEELLERLLALRNDLGLLSEEYDVAADRQVGNFPQAFTHLALVDAVLTLSGRRGRIPTRD
jgi:GH15 family glucan-1,4-alpha-glucosidase